MANQIPIGIQGTPPKWAEAELKDLAALLKILQQSTAIGHQALQRRLTLMPHKIQAAIREDREARSAAHIAMVTNLTLDAALFQLRKLEGEGQIRHKVDSNGVMRWQLVEPEEVKPGLVALDVMVRLTNGTYDLTPAARKALGL